MNSKKKIVTFIAAAVSLVLVVGLVWGAGKVFGSPDPGSVVQATDKKTYTGKTPKYVFLFIGDGMSYPQIQITSDYLGAVREPNPEILKGNDPVNFMNFRTAGSAITYDSTSFCPDSASTATSLATGHKTHSGVIGMDETKAINYPTIAEQLKAQKGFKIGIVTTVNLNHATPAAFYAHQPSRNQYYEISEQLAKSGFDYFAGGGLKQEKGKDKDKTSSYDIIKKAGYKLIKTQAEAEKVTPDTGKVVIIDEHLADSSAMAYDIDRPDKDWGLKDYVRKGIEVLDNDKGFFMMVEGGKIDWACHANDAGATVNDTIALADAVQEAINFMNQHKDETLIVVTGDHETGGLTIGFAGTNYDTFLHNLSAQKISYAKFDSDYVSKYIKNKTPFTEALKDVEKLFGLKAPAKDADKKDADKKDADKKGNDKKDADKEDKFVLTDYEYGQLEDAYKCTVEQTFKNREMTQEEYVLYGHYEPFTVTITHLLNNKSGIDFSSYSHTGLPVGVFAEGAGREMFEGYYDNTDVYHKMAQLLKVKAA